MRLWVSSFSSATVFFFLIGVFPVNLSRASAQERLKLPPLIDIVPEGTSLDEDQRTDKQFNQSELQKLLRALENVRKAKDRKTEANLLNQIGEVHARLGQYTEALYSFELALEIYRKSGDRLEEANTLRQLANLLEEANTLRQLVIPYAQLVTKETISPQLPIETQPSGIVAEGEPEGTSLSELEVRARALSYDQVLALRQQALEVYKQINDRPKQAETLNDIGSAYQNLGQYPQAIRSYQAALDMFTALGKPIGKGNALNNIGEVHRKQGQYSRALNSYDPALSIFRATADKVGEGAVLNNTGVVHDELGQHSVAISFYERALNLRRAGDDLSGVGTTLHNLGFAHDQLGQNEKALRFYQDSLAIRRENSNFRGEAITLNNLGLVYNELGQHTQALESLQKALKTFEELGDRPNTGNTLDSIATVHKSLKHYPKALEYYKRAIQVLREVNDRTTEGIVLTNQGDLYERMGDKTKAISTYQQAIDGAIETIFSELKGEELKAAFSDKHADTYARLINLLWDAERFEDAFNYVERARARAFLNQIVSGPVNFRAGADAALLEQEQALRVELANLNAQLVSLSRHIVGEDKQSISSIKAKLDARQQDYAQLLEQMKRRSPEAADLVGVNPAKLSVIQQLLDRDTTLVEYFVTDNRTLAFLITRNGFKPITLKVGRLALLETVQSLYEYDFATLQTPYSASLQQLYLGLVQPLKPYISTKKLGIVPHDILHYVPFSALTNGQQFLIDDYTLFSLPSASVMRFLAEKRKPDNGRLLVLGNPTLDLFHATQEAEVVADLYNTSATVGMQATEGMLWSQARQGSILHLATHGEYNPSSPLFSTLFLASGNGYDGRLEVHEIYGLDLTTVTNLVVLSACQTQAGKLSRGDELVGLNRAFLYAGTPSVIASLWNIDDKVTGLIMKQFYGNLRQGIGKAEALQKAQREVRNDYAHPYYWAAFVLTGDGN